MKRAIVAAALVAGGGGLALLACDLFHSTSFVTLCEVDATAAGCADGAAVTDAAKPTDFCDAWSPSVALGKAQRACAWLSACESPLGANDFGPCMIAALLAYDCAANPDRPVRGALHDYWDALWQAQTCADVDRVVFPGAGPADKVPTCANTGFAGCGQAYDGGDNSAVRAECDVVDAASRGESCLVQGRTCDGDAGACVGAAKGGCLTGCSGSLLEDCDDAGVDRGTDCSLFGAGRCVVTPGAPACSGTNSASCTPTAIVACDAGVAQGCPSGNVERVDCNTLTGDSSCNPGPASPTWNVSTSCFRDGGSCGPDTCSGTGQDILTSCAAGQTFTTSCANAGLHSCVLAMTVDGMRAACGLPL